MWVIIDWPNISCANSFKNELDLFNIPPATYVGAGGFLGKGLIYGLVKQNDDWNNYIENGCYNVNLDNGINRPLGADDFGFLLVVSYKGVVLTQIFVASITTTTLYFRLKHGDNWSKWQKVTSVRVESSTNII